MIRRSIASVAFVAALIAAPAMAQAPAADTAALLDPNNASEAQLASLPHMTPVLARTLIQRRPFLNMLAVDSLLATSLTRDQLGAVYRRMFLRLHLNTASREEIMLIPGVGRRMAYEFSEYRPYNDIARFRREIGKYVNAEEVARLERYVRID